MNHRKRTRRRFLRRLPVFVLLLCAAALFFRWSNTSLQITRTDLSFSRLPEGFDGCRIAVLGDLHSAEFGEDNADLIAALRSEKPDYLFLVGDLVDSFRDVPEDYAAKTAAALSAVAPTYYVTGNHEWAACNVRELKATLEAQGVTVLSNAHCTLERNGEALVLAGVDDPNGYADQKSPEAVAAEVYSAHGDAFWVLLAHRNTLFESRYSHLGADLVVSGHGHGGLIRLPFTDGLIAADHSLFPSYTAGLYEQNGSALFVTRGLGNSGVSFRLFNRPEIALLTLHKG